MQVLLQQLAASIAAIKQQEAQQQLKQDGSTTSNPVQKVQVCVQRTSGTTAHSYNHARKTITYTHT